MSCRGKTRVLLSLVFDIVIPIVFCIVSISSGVVGSVWGALVFPSYPGTVGARYVLLLALGGSVALSFAGAAFLLLRIVWVLDEHCAAPDSSLDERSRTGRAFDLSNSPDKVPGAPLSRTNCRAGFTEVSVQRFEHMVRHIRSLPRTRIVLTWAAYAGALCLVTFFSMAYRAVRGGSFSGDPCIIWLWFPLGVQLGVFSLFQAFVACAKNRTHSSCAEDSSCSRDRDFPKGHMQTLLAGLMSYATRRSGGILWTAYLAGLLGLTMMAIAALIGSFFVGFTAIEKSVFLLGVLSVILTCAAFPCGAFLGSNRGEPKK